MNDMNNFNNGYYQRMPNEYPGIPAPQKPPKKRKPHTTAKVAAMLAAVIAIGGGAGFGGAYFANRAQVSAVVDTPNAGKGDSSSDNGTTSSNSVSVIDRENAPTLDEMQQDVTLPQNNLTSSVELNTD